MPLPHHPRQPSPIRSYKVEGGFIWMVGVNPIAKVAGIRGYPLKAGQLTYDCRHSTMHGMPVTGSRGFRGLKPLGYNGVPP